MARGPNQRTFRRLRRPTGSAPSNAGDAGGDTGSAGPAIGNADGAVDPDTLAPAAGSASGAPGGDTSGEQPAKRRGGWPAGKPRKPAQELVLAGGSVAQSLNTLTGVIAVFIGEPEIEFPMEDCEQIGKAVAEVSKHYNIPVLKPEHAALAGLAAVTAKVCKARYKAIAAKRQAPRRPAAPPPQPGPAAAAAAPPAPAPGGNGGAPSWFPDLDHLPPGVVRN